MSRPLADLRVQRRRADPRQSGGSRRRHRPDVHQTAHDTHAMSSPPGHAHTSEWITVALLADVGLSWLCACVCVLERQRGLMLGKHVVKVRALAVVCTVDSQWNPGPVS